MKKDGARLYFIMAFWQIYETHTIEEISVRDLCKRAGYNRSTFYLYFSDKYDLLDKAVEELLAPGRALLESLDDFALVLKTDRMVRLFRQDNLMEDKLKGVLRPLVLKSLGGGVNAARIEYIMEYHVSAVFGTYRAWLKNGKDLPKEEIVQILYTLSNVGVFSMLDKPNEVPEVVISAGDAQRIDAFLNTLQEDTHAEGGGPYVAVHA